jgi:hypothetical protein
MDVSQVIERAARLLWQHKTLAALGSLDIVLTGSGLLARTLVDWLLQLALLSPALQDRLGPLAGRLPSPLISIGQLGELYRRMSPYGTGGWVGLIGGVCLMLIALAVTGVAIEGGIIAAASEIDRGAQARIRAGLTTGWRRILPMVVIASVPAIPLTVGAIVVILIGTGMAQGAGGLAALAGSPSLAQQVVSQLSLIGLAVVCPLAAVTLPLALLNVLAYRACMLEGTDAVASFRRAWQVLRARPGPVLVLILVSYGLSLLAGAVATVPNQLALIFLPAALLVWLIQGIARGYYLVVWTLGWRAWTGPDGAPSG